MLFRLVLISIHRCSVAIQSHLSKCKIPMRNEKLDLLEIMESGDRWLFLEATDIYML